MSDPGTELPNYPLGLGNMCHSPVVALWVHSNPQPYGAPPLLVWVEVRVRPSSYKASGMRRRRSTLRFAPP
jgi:hypothetical protein